MLAKEKHTSFIKSTAKTLGFNYCGIATAKKLDDDASIGFIITAGVFDYYKSRNNAY